MTTEDDDDEDEAVAARFVTVWLVGSHAGVVDTSEYQEYDTVL